jgi:hypothetical protein
MKDSSASNALPLSLVHDVDEDAGRARPAPQQGLATVVARSDDGVLIAHAGTQWSARIATADPVEDAIGETVLVSFVGDQAFVIGLLRAPRPAPHDPGTLEIDADRLCLVAKRELVLRCGPGSIRLTSEGRIVIDGIHLVSRAQASNRIRGGSIHLN